MESVLDLSVICRTCLCATPRSISILAKDLKFDIQLKTMITKVSSIEVDENDELPNKLCYACAKQLRDSFEFQQMCENSHDILYNYRKQLHHIGTIDHSTQLGEIGKNSVEDQHKDRKFDVHTNTCDSDRTAYETADGNGDLEAELVQGDINQWVNQCPICQRILSKPSHLKRHMASHADSKPFQCTLCPKSFARSDNLQKHIDTHSEQRNFRCKHCDKSFKREDTLKNHQRVLHTQSIQENSHVCSFCKCVFSDEAQLNAHLKHHDKQKNFVCDVCGKMYAELFQYTMHVRKHASKPVATVPFICSHCGKQLSCKRNLTIHMRIHEGIKQFKCTYCEKGFLRKTDLKVHENYHTEAKKYTCSICEKSFLLPYTLKLHMRGHTGEKPYKCPHCPKRFNQSYVRTTHVRRHTGQRLMCDKCDDCFLHPYQLNYHLKSVHHVDAECRRRGVSKITGMNAQAKNVPPDRINHKDEQ